MEFIFVIIKLDKYVRGPYNATSDKRQATSDKRQATSDKRQLA